MEVEVEVEQIDAEMTIYSNDHTKLETLFADKLEKENILNQMWEEYEGIQT